MASKSEKLTQSLSIAVLTVSDTRGEEQDTSGQYLVAAASEAGHKVLEKKIVIDDKYQIRAQLSQWIASTNIQVVLVTGGTGLLPEIPLQKLPQYYLTSILKALENCLDIFLTQKSVPLLCNLAH